MKSICFVAQFPPPIHGLSKAVDTLYKSSIGKVNKLESIDLKSNMSIFSTIGKLLFVKCDLFYFTLSQSLGGNWRDLLILNIIKLRRKKFLIHLHGGFYRNLIEQKCGKVQRMLNYNAIKGASGVIVLGKSLVSIFQGMIDEDRIFIVPNCVDNEYVLENSLFLKKKEKMGVQPVFHLLYLSNFIATKGYREVLYLALIAKKKNCNSLHFHFAGNFFKVEDELFFRNFIVENQLHEYVTFHGVVLGDSKRNLLKLCNAFILLTRYPNEGQPISILEAMGSGMAVITTNHAGIPDIVKNGINGFVVDKMTINLDEIYTCILKLKNDRYLLNNMVEQNYNDIRNKYTEKIYVTKMNNVFEKMLCVS